MFVFVGVCLDLVLELGNMGCGLVICWYGSWCCLYYWLVWAVVLVLVNMGLGVVLVLISMS